MNLGKMPLQDQLRGLDRLAKEAMKLHRVNLLVDPGDRGDVAALRAAHGYDLGLEAVYVVGGYDLWRDGRLLRTDLTVEQAAFAIVNGYMRAKATVVLMRDHGFSAEQASDFLEEDERRESFFSLLDQGSDRMRAIFVQASTS